ncbi:fructose-bisphosphate aldolase [Streptomyces violarus]|uniref:2-amino-4, 5-dihydroxy-6-oxo-7-(Phosphonooxy)heptanoate synthase n=2 Tax=Streptomyces TaxID=1883 RepID=A0A7W4ZSZ4_9ACTN|nr:2-amino-3,7-dideoxy-D-threo-hept-6-ulosonate synthase [Streptomyces violarus]MBB3078104.1 2-amino-4,5-dihydroxy-6-oxo-7-(phosphonooxy)heptanoate synthase [Streptomyces violarus]GHD19702.1 fructose-bisphosphate aldolase [Streptomyces violarus]
MMFANLSFGRRLRLRRLFGNDDRLFVVALDHPISDGPIITRGGLGSLVAAVAANGADAVVLHKGGLRQIDPARFSDISLILHLSASTAQAPDPDAKYLVSGVQEALRYGADAVSVHVNLGSAQEQEQIADLGRVSDLCDRWNVPLLAMVYPRGPKVTNPGDPQLVAHAITLAAELGADVVKTSYAGTPADMADVVKGASIPVIVAGGPRRSAVPGVLAYVEEALGSGVSGVAMGRNIFQAADPGTLTRRVADLIHPDGDAAPREAPALHPTARSPQPVLG